MVPSLMYVSDVGLISPWDLVTRTDVCQCFRTYIALRFYGTLTNVCQWCRTYIALGFVWCLCYYSLYYFMWCIGLPECLKRTGGWGCAGGEFRLASEFTELTELTDEFIRTFRLIRADHSLRRRGGVFLWGLLVAGQSTQKLLLFECRHRNFWNHSLRRRGGVFL